MKRCVLLTAFEVFAMAGMAVAGTTSVDLYSDSSTSPGGLVANLGTIPDYPYITLVDVTLASNPVLSAGTRYWIGLSSTDSTNLWSWTTDTSGVGVNGEFFDNQNGVAPNNPDGGYQMQVGVNGTVVYDSTAAVSNGADPITTFGPLYDSFSTGASSGPISSLELVVGTAVAPTPEPATAGLCGLALLGLAASRRRRARG